jgi:hypothetical protein
MCRMETNKTFLMPKKPNLHTNLLNKLLFWLIFFFCLLCGHHHLWPVTTEYGGKKKCQKIYAPTRNKKEFATATGFHLDQLVPS